MLQPCFEIPKKRTKKFDKNLCIVCQKEVQKPKRGPSPKRDASSFQVFIDVVKILQGSGDTQYNDLYEVINGKKCEDLEKEKLCYHAVPCRENTFKSQTKNQRSTTTNEKIE